MAKKRKSDTASLDEVDRTMYITFCTAANSLSQLYTQAMNHQRLSFQAGVIFIYCNFPALGCNDLNCSCLEKLYQWILRQQEEGSRVATVDIVAYLQNELEYGAEEPPLSPRLPIQNQHSQAALNNSGPPFSSIPYVPAAVGPGVRSGQLDHQAKNSVFSNALSSPVCQSLQHYHLTQGSYQMPPGNGPQNSDTNNAHHHQQNKDANSPISHSMDMHADGPGHEFTN